jgi:hypothetical protein
LVELHLALVELHLELRLALVELHLALVELRLALVELPTSFSPVSLQKKKSFFLRNQSGGMTTG